MKKLKQKLSILKWVTDIGFEFYKGFKTLRNIGPCVTIYGSARFDQNNEHYKLTVEMGKELAQAGFAVMTGGGPGIMEAANRGAKEAGGHSIGCNIQLPREQDFNPYVERKVMFKHFFVRKYMLTKFSSAFIAAPGGFGTLDELFEVITLVQTNKKEKCPIYLLNTSFWKPIIEFARKEMILNKTIDFVDLNLIRYSDNPKEIIRNIKMEQAKKDGSWNENWSWNGHAVDEHLIKEAHPLKLVDDLHITEDRQQNSLNKFKKIS